MSQAHHRTIDCLTMIEQRLPALKGTSRRVGEAILRDPWAVLGMTIYDVAAASGVSLPSVTRFCRAVGFAGFRELVQGVAQSLGRIDSKDLAALDLPEAGEQGLPGLAARIVARQIEALQDTLRTLDWGDVESATEAVANARSVTCVGHGGGYVFAYGMAVKLTWAGVMASPSTPDFFSNQLMAIDKGDVVISISFQGRTRDIVDMQRMARDYGATTISVSMVASSPLADTSDIHLVALSPELARGGTFLVAYNALLVVADIIAAAVIDRKWGGKLPRHDSVADWMESRFRVGPVTPERKPRQRAPRTTSETNGAEES